MRAISVAAACLSGILAATAVPAAEYYANDFEEKAEFDFSSVYGAVGSDPERYHRNAKELETAGVLVVHRAVLTDQNEGRSHSGVRSFALDVTLDKVSAKWGAKLFWGGGPKLSVKLDRPVYVGGFVLPASLPPDVTVLMTALFTGTDRKTGKTINGSKDFPHSGVDGEGWLVFNADVAAVINKDYEETTLTGWQLTLRSPFGKAFQNRRVSLFLDDVTVADAPPALAFDAKKEARFQEILSDDPYVVNFTSSYRSFPAGAANRVKNPGFELGMRDWYVLVSMPWTGRADTMPKSDGFPDPGEAVRIESPADAPEGASVLLIERADGRPTRVVVETPPIGIEDGKPYTVSFAARADRPTALIVNGNNVELTTEWKRHVVRLPAIVPYTRWNGKAFPGRFILSFAHTGTETVRLDAVQLAAGDASEFQAPGFVDLAARPKAKFGLYVDGPAGATAPERAFAVTVNNGAAAAKSATVKWVVKNHRREIVSEATRVLDLAPAATRTFEIAVPPGLRHATLYATVSAPDQPDQTASSSLASIPDVANRPGNDFFGSLIAGHNFNNLRWLLELNRLAGMGWLPLYHTNYVARARPDWRDNDLEWQPLEFVLGYAGVYGLAPVVTVYEPIPKSAPKDADGIPVVGPAEEKEIYEYCLAMARRFKGRVKYYEVFAEFMKDPLAPRAQAVAKALPAAYRGLKEGDPDCVVVACGEDGLYNIGDQLEAHFKLGTLAYMDALSLHPYGASGADFPATLAMVRGLMAKYGNGKVKPVWGTEAGMRGLDTLYYDGIDFETMYYPNFVTELGQAEGNVRMNVMALGEGMERNATFHLYNGYGGVDCFSFVQRDNGFYPKILFPAFATLVDQLAGAKAEGRFDRPDGPVRGYFFRKADGLFAAVWSDAPAGKTVSARIDLDPTALTAVNLVGEPVALAAEGGKTVLPLTGGTIYLRPKGIDEAAFRKALETMTAGRLGLTVSLSGPETLRAVLKAGEGASSSGTIGLVGGAAGTAFTLKPGETRDFAFPAAWNGASAVFAVKATDGTEGITARYAALRVDGTPVALGGAAFVSLYEARWRGDADLSATVTPSWDKEYFRLAVAVRDDRHCAPHAAGSQLLWANDALQLAFAPLDAGERSIVELALADSPAGAAAAVTRGTLDLSGVTRSVRRDGDVTRYDVAIPWRALGESLTPAPGRPIGLRFNLAVSDNDGDGTIALPKLEGYEKSLQLSPGLVEKKDPSLWPELVLGRSR